jgi:TRAP-type mannitol/chloroaromatic compound transport system permease small subunit
MRALLAFSRVIDSINFHIGKWLSWLILAAVTISAVNAIIRKLFDASSNAWLEMQWLLFGVVFLMCSPWTLMSNEHIRIDIVNSMFSKWLRNWIDVIGHIFFLMPLCIIIIYTSWPSFTRSYAIGEQSMNAGGLPQWPAKGLIVIGFFMLLIQAFSELIKRVAVMRGLIDDPYGSDGGLHAAAEAEAERLLAEARAQQLLPDSPPDAR